MNRIKLMLLALLGFSAACSSVRRNTQPAGGERSAGEIESEIVEPRIRVLYGPRPPMPITPEQQERLSRADSLMRQAQEDSLGGQCLGGEPQREIDPLTEKSSAPAEAEAPGEGGIR